MTKRVSECAFLDTHAHTSTFITRKVDGVTMKQELQSLFGWELFHLRREFGYRAREYAEHLKRESAPITSARSVYRLEAEHRVPQRYVESFRRMVGADLFDQKLQQLRSGASQYGQMYRRQIKMIAERDREVLQHEEERTCTIS